jgi:hypothetical protein
MEYKVYDGNPPIVIDNEDEIDSFLDELDDLDDLE